MNYPDQGPILQLHTLHISLLLGSLGRFRLRWGTEEGHGQDVHSTIVEMTFTRDHGGFEGIVILSLDERKAQSVAERIGHVDGLLAQGSTAEVTPEPFSSDLRRGGRDHDWAYNAADVVIIAVDVRIGESVSKTKIGVHCGCAFHDNADRLSANMTDNTSPCEENRQD